MQIEKIRNEKLKEKIVNTNGRFFSVTFIKKNGETRKLHGRTKVLKYLKGGNNVNPNVGTEHLVMYSLADKGYRTLNLNTVIDIQFKGK